MPQGVVKWVFFGGLLLGEVLRVPHRWRNSRDRVGKRIVRSGLGLGESLLMTLAWVGTFVLPVVYVFTGWPAFSAYSLPATWSGLAGTLVLVASLILFWRSHVERTSTART